MKFQKENPQTLADFSIDRVLFKFHSQLEFL